MTTRENLRITLALSWLRLARNHTSDAGLKRVTMWINAAVDCLKDAQEPEKESHELSTADDS